MKRRILHCDICNEDTRHLVTEKYSTTRMGCRQRRTVKHCCQCNVRIIHNGKNNTTYKKGMGQLK